VVTLRDSIVKNNQAEAAGGLELAGSTALFMASTVADNEAQYGTGGGVRVGKGVDSQPSHIDMRRSTVSGNSARDGAVTAGSGGGIVIVDSTAIIEASTISGNFALGKYGSGGSPDANGGQVRKEVEGIGGGIAVLSGGETVHDTWLHMVSCTLADNISSAKGGAVGLYRHNGAATVEAIFRNSLMASNRELGGVSPGTCANVSADRFGQDQWPKSEAVDPVRFQSQGHNMVDEASCEFDQATDMVVEDAMLSELDYHGVNLKVHMPLEGSPAIDAGRSGVNYDQRGYPRNVDGDGNGSCICDCGAVEAYSEPRQGTQIPIPGEDQRPEARVPPPSGYGSGDG
jgi:hypothetical protein